MPTYKTDTVSNSVADGDAMQVVYDVDKEADKSLSLAASGHSANTNALSFNRIQYFNGPSDENKLGLSSSQMRAVAEMSLADFPADSDWTVSLLVDVGGIKRANSMYDPASPAYAVVQLLREDGSPFIGASLSYKLSNSVHTALSSLRYVKDASSFESSKCHIRHSSSGASTDYTTEERIYNGTFVPFTVMRRGDHLFWAFNEDGRMKKCESLFTSTFPHSNDTLGGKPSDFPSRLAGVMLTPPLQHNSTGLSVKFDSLRIFNRALTDGEVEAIHKNITLNLWDGSFLADTWMSGNQVFDASVGTRTTNPIFVDTSGSNVYHITTTNGSTRFRMAFRNNYGTWGQTVIYDSQAGDPDRPVVLDAGDNSIGKHYTALQIYYKHSGDPETAGVLIKKVA